MRPPPNNLNLANGVANLGPQTPSVHQQPIVWFNINQVIRQAIAFTGYTAVHEFGHLLGARHQREAKGGDVNDDYTGCNCAHVNNYSSPDEARTIVATITGGRQLLFSTPLVSLSGAPAGTQDRNYNARWISNTFCSLSSVSSGGLEMLAAPNAEIIFKQGCARGIQLSANAFNVPAGVEYQWSVSRVDPVFSNSNPGVQFSSDPDPYFSIQGGGIYHFEISLLDPTSGNQFRASLSVLVPDNVWCPTVDAHLALPTKSSNRTIYDLTGRLVARLKPGQHELSANLSLVPGAYLLREGGSSRLIYVR